MNYLTGALSSASQGLSGAVGAMVYGTDESHEYQVPCGRMKTVPEIDDEKIKLVNGDFYKAYLAVMDDKRWEPVQWEDPEKEKGGDLKLLTKEQDWNFHFIKATFTARK